jgi:uncharacterized membrane protein
MAMVASFLRMFDNLDGVPHPGDFSPRVYSVMPIAIGCYYIFVNRNAIEHRYEKLVPIGHAWLGTIAVATLTWYEIGSDWTVAAWACLTLLILAVAWALKLHTFTQQGMVFSIFVLLRAVVANFDGLVPGWTNASLAVAGGAAILLGSLYFCFRIRAEASENSHTSELTLDSLSARPEQPLFFVPLVMATVLLALEMRHGLITVSWGIEGVLVFLFALMVNERSFRLSGLALLLLCVGKVVIIDVWGLNLTDRYITFIIIGSALILVSFLYTRHRDTIKQYL